MTNEEKALKQLLELKMHLISRMTAGNYALHPADMLIDINKIIEVLNVRA